MNIEPIRILFNNWIIQAFMHEGQLMVACKPICEMIGLDWSAQRKKLKEDPSLRCGDIASPSAGGLQMTRCIPKNRLGAWLYSINPRKVNYEYRQILEQFQENIVSVIDSYLHNTLTHEKLQLLEEIVSKLRIEVAELREENKELKVENNSLRRERGLPPKYKDSTGPRVY